MSLTDRLLGPILRDDAARPLITFYDDRDGSRVELSAATLANWAAKTANWLRDDCDVEVGDPVHVALPAHWQTAGVLLGAWWCGAHVVDNPAGAAVSLVAPDAVSGATTASARAAPDPAATPPPGVGPDAAAGRPAVRAAVALDPLGRGLPEPPDGHLDYIGETRVHGDHFHPIAPVPADTPALLGASVDELAATTAERAAALGITPGARVLSSLEWSLPQGLTDGLLAILAARASLVHCANPDPAALAKRRTTEHVTLTLGG